MTDPTGSTMRAGVLDGPPEALRIRGPCPFPCPRPAGSSSASPRPASSAPELQTRLGLAEGVTFPRFPNIEAAGIVAACPGGEFEAGQQVVAMTGGMGRTIDGG